MPVPDFTRAIEPLVTFDKWNHKKILLDIEPKSQDKIPPEGNPTL